jgi:hypothetical protein
VNGSFPGPVVSKWPGLDERKAPVIGELTVAVEGVLASVSLICRRGCRASGGEEGKKREEGGEKRDGSDDNDGSSFSIFDPRSSLLDEEETATTGGLDRAAGGAGEGAAAGGIGAGES